MGWLGKRRMCRVAPLAVLFLVLLVQGAEGRGIWTHSFYSINLLEANLSSGEYAAGSEVFVRAKLRNVGDYALDDGILVLSLVDGCKAPVQPPHSSDCDNVFHEVYQNVTLGLGEVGDFSFGVTLPGDLKGGTYRADLYLKTPRGRVQGNHESYDPAISLPFSVSGSGNFPRAKMLRSTTNIEGAFSQSGPLVARGSALEGWVAFANTADSEFRGKLVEELCTFGDLSLLGCTPVSEYAVSIGANQAGGVVTATPTDVSPDAYAVLYKLVDEGGRIHSIYKNRIIVGGRTAKLVALAVDRADYAPEGRIKFEAGVTGPLFPEQSGVSDVRVVISQYGIKDVIASTSFNRSFLDVDEITLFTGNFSVPESAGSGRICASVLVAGAEADFRCVAYSVVDAQGQVAGSSTGQAGPAGGSYGLVILIVAVALAVFLFARKKRGVAAVVLLVLVASFSAFSYGVPCPPNLHPRYYLDRNGNGVLEPSEELTNLPLYKDGTKFLPVNAVIEGGEPCGDYVHWCGNTATHGTATYPTFSVTQDAMVIWVDTLRYNMTLFPADVVATVGQYVYPNISLAHRVDLYPPLAVADVPALDAIISAGNMSALEVAIANGTFQNYSRRVGQLPDTNVTLTSFASSLVKLNVTNGSSSQLFYVSLERAYQSFFGDGKIKVDVNKSTTFVGIGPSPKVLADNVREYKLVDLGIVNVAGSGGTYSVTDNMSFVCTAKGCEAVWT